MAHGHDAATGPLQMQKELMNNRCVAENKKVLEEIIKCLEIMSEDMDKIYVQTQLLLCDLIICCSSPEKMEVIKRGEESYKQYWEISDEKE
ncbi:synaptonemal complex central element protein 3 isoform X2 [Amblyraja radiata]|uniref:synaptonemal complex central element protein 3 isoform X2 n=1 Tax=Amblyraja radiata TaxID=386614 RepID=UPI0014037741|nr:synaptonemal complex central element protein 3 isoform X2 [Amblyraja radiata]